MTDETFKYLTLDGLLDLMVISTKELLEVMDEKDEIGIRVKKKQVELLQQIIDSKKKKTYAKHQ